ncbi:Uncharacterised protein [Mycobacteroides abscessus]|nr:Uncharacterised protein [Mycobacteroides abscessus]
MNSKPSFQNFEIFASAAVSLLRIASRTAALASSGSSISSAFWPTTCAGTNSFVQLSSQSPNGLSYTTVIDLLSSEISGFCEMSATPGSEPSK